MPTAIVAVLIVAAIALLVRSLLSGRRDRDPAASVDSFQRAMTAMGNDATGARQPEPPSEDERPDRGETVGRR